MTKATNQSHSNEESRIVNENFALVVSQALKFNPPGGITDLDDLISVGSIGLLRAIRNFDENKGCRFSTYATTCIQNEMKRELKKFKQSSFEIVNEISSESPPDIWEFLPEYLNETEKKILYMRIIEGRTFKDIGSHMGKTKAWASAKMIEILDRIREANGY